MRIIDISGSDLAIQNRLALLTRFSPDDIRFFDVIFSNRQVQLQTSATFEILP